MGGPSTFGGGHHAKEKGVELEDFVAEFVEATVRAASDNQPELDMDQLGSQIPSES